MLVKVIENEGTKYEIFKNGANYSFKHYEYYSACGWKYLFGDENYSKSAIEFEFDIEL